MNIPKRVGIWMDHAGANIMAFIRDPIETTTIRSDFTHLQKEQSLRRSETLMHHREQHEEAAYYNAIGEVIRHYDEVILFGPTDAKAELLNRLRNDHRFASIKIETKQTDVMTDKQQHAFVRDYYLDQLV